MPTVIEDDIFGAVGGLELGLESQLAEHAAAAAAGMRAEGPHEDGELCRGLIVRNVPQGVPDEELRHIFSVSDSGRCRWADGVNQPRKEKRRRRQVLPLLFWLFRCSQVVSN